MTYFLFLSVTKFSLSSRLEAAKSAFAVCVRLFGIIQSSIKAVVHSFHMSAHSFFFIFQLMCAIFCPICLWLSPCEKLCLQEKEVESLSAALLRAYRVASVLCFSGPCEMMCILYEWVDECVGRDWTTIGLLQVEVVVFGEKLFLSAVYPVTMMKLMLVLVLNRCWWLRSMNNANNGFPSFFFFFL